MIHVVLLIMGSAANPLFIAFSPKFAGICLSLKLYDCLTSCI